MASVHKPLRYSIEMTSNIEPAHNTEVSAVKNMIFHEFYVQAFQDATI